MGQLEESTAVLSSIQDQVTIPQRKPCENHQDNTGQPTGVAGAEQGDITGLEKIVAGCRDKNGLREIGLVLDSLPPTKVRMKGSISVNPAKNAIQRKPWTG